MNPVGVKYQRTEQYHPPMGVLGHSHCVRYDHFAPTGL